VSSGELSLSFFFDLFSLVFCLVVLMIRRIVMFYRLNYLAPYSKSKYFLVLTALFVCSMLLVLTISNLFFIMLG
jgi:NADH:ubiquinone oxidoreductase subunit 5 (subunit L)/multisubunit Na+/H+ antiporter MnhA subunit